MATADFAQKNEEQSRAAVIYTFRLLPLRQRRHLELFEKKFFSSGAASTGVDFCVDLRVRLSAADLKMEMVLKAGRKFRPMPTMITMMTPMMLRVSNELVSPSAHSEGAAG